MGGMVVIIQLVEIAHDFALLRPGELHRIGKHIVMGLLVIKQNRDYMTLSHTLYGTMKTEFRLELDGKLQERNLPGAVAPEVRSRIGRSRISAHTYQTTDHLEALLLWTLDDMAANMIAMRRCAYCGRYFLPYSVVNCYCDRLVKGSGGKTCKEVGAVTKHQEEVNSDTAKALYRKVNNRTQQAAKRLEAQYPNIRKVNYRQWQLEVKLMLEKVQTGEMDYESFAIKIDKAPRELLGLTKEN